MKRKKFKLLVPSILTGLMVLNSSLAFGSDCTYDINRGQINKDVSRIVLSMKGQNLDDCTEIQNQGTRYKTSTNRDLSINWNAIRKFADNDFSRFYKKDVENNNSTTRPKDKPSTNNNIIIENNKKTSTNNDVVIENSEKPSTNNNVTIENSEKPSTNNNVTIENSEKPSTNNNVITTSNSIQMQIVNLVNAERSKAGLEPLKYSAELSKVAQTKSQDMSDKGYFSHTSPTYGSPFDMMKQFGISYSYAGENIAMGQRSAEQVMNGWMNSAGHRKNILSPNFTEIGVGYVVNKNGTPYWTQMFIRP
ncbi:CAP domain-containing protein [Clostridiisalibacter paucivorans]|uniref:CAP domain-containing protein n=1 Tax=Clostridiisalibacter paucivorans TaxID=408753 RepID=UPI00047A86FA|nr:CAP domain-containing protein [Clostridiisalibacter paucivorans]